MPLMTRMPHAAFDRRALALAIVLCPRAPASAQDRQFEAEQVREAVTLVEGNHAPEDVAKGIATLKPSANRGDSSARLYSGSFYERGIGVLVTRRRHFATSAWPQIRARWRLNTVSAICMIQTRRRSETTKKASDGFAVPLKVDRRSRRWIWASSFCAPRPAIRATRPKNGSNWRPNTLAADAGYKETEAQREEVGRQMSLADLTEGNRRVDAWKAKNQKK